MQKNYLALFFVVAVEFLLGLGLGLWVGALALALRFWHRLHITGPPTVTFNNQGCRRPFSFEGYNDAITDRRKP